MYLNERLNRKDLTWQEIKKSLPEGTTFHRTGRGIRFTEPETEYDRQAAAFLARFGIILTIELAGTMPPPWSDSNSHYGLCYNVTLHWREQRYYTPFWTSYRDSYYAHGMWAGLGAGYYDFYCDPTPYDVLAGVSCNISMSTDPDEIWSEFGKDMPPSRAQAIAADTLKLQRFFSTDEVRDALAEIQ